MRIFHSLVYTRVLAFSAALFCCAAQSQSLPTHLDAVKSVASEVPEGEGLRIVVKPKALLDRQAGMSGIQQLVSAQAKIHGLLMEKVLELGTGGISYEISRPLDIGKIATLLSVLEASEAVEYVEPVGRMYPDLTPNDTRYNEQWHYYETTGGIRLPNAWDRANGSGQRVAVIDTGSIVHADLSANFVGGYDMISSAAAARDGNGRDANPRDEGNWNNASECFPLPQRDSNWHGAHVAGTVAALTNNGAGVAGAAFSARVVPVRALGRCGGTWDDIADAIVWAAGGAVPGIPTNPNPATILNLSLGSSSPASCPAVIQDAINDARNHGASIIVSAGNSNGNANSYSLANCQNVIAVAATNRSGGRANYSNTGSVVDIAAPGGVGGGANGVLSTINSGTTTPVASPAGDAYAFYQGTSMAAPHVSGTLALLRNEHPSLSRDEAELRLMATARAFPTSCPGCGSGIVNADAATSNHPTVTVTPSYGGMLCTNYSDFYDLTANLSFPTTAAVSVNLVFSGSGQLGVNYTSSSGTTITIPAGQTSGFTRITAVSGSQTTNTVTVSVSSISNGIEVGSQQSSFSYGHGGGCT